MLHACRWLLPIDGPPLERAWIETSHGVIRRFGRGAPPAPAVDLGDVVVMPGLVNAHTHLELSWMAGRVPPADSMVEWIRAMMRVRGSVRGDVTPSQVTATTEALAVMRASGTVLVGDVSNSLATPLPIAASGIRGVVFHELIGFNPADAVAQVTAAIAALDRGRRLLSEHGAPVHLTLSAHAPYSVAPALFREIAARVTDGPLALHLAESAEELEFLRTGSGPMRDLLEELGAWTSTWQAPGTGPVDYVQNTGYIRPGVMAVHGVHLTDDELAQLREARATIVTCPRSNLWVGAGMPRVSHFYASGVPVAVGTDSLASVDSLSMFDELAELRRIAPDVAAASLLESATRIGAEALGFGATHGTIAVGKSAALIAVDVPSSVLDVEEYLVSGVSSSAVRFLS
jgi:cytosine/adenosine deaminase-related metal-dependent hydrolase